MTNGDSTNNHNTPKDQDSQKERLVRPITPPIRFGSYSENLAAPNNNQDRRNVEQWQLDSTNAEVKYIMSCVRRWQIMSQTNNDRDEAEDSVEEPAVVDEKAVRGRSLPWNIISFLWLIFKLLLLMAVIVGILYLVKYHIYDDWNYVGYFFDLLDIDYPHFF